MAKHKKDNIEDRDFLSVSECARTFSVDRKSILNWIHKGMLKAYTTAGGRFRVLKSEVERLKTSTGLKDKVKKVMIIDDEEIVINTFTNYFERLYPNIVEVHSSQSGIQGVITIGNLNPDLLLLDIKMPEMDGFKVVEELKNSKPDLKILMVSAFLGEENLKRMKEVGVTEYLEKPVDIWMFKEKIDKLLMMI